MPKRSIVPEDVSKLTFVGDPQISPDGSRVLFSHKTVDAKQKYVTHLFSVDVEGGALRQWTSAEGGAGNGRWSPDGKQIAFVSGRDKPASQIYLIPTDGGEAKKLTDLPEGSIGGLQWSPDGKKIAFLFRATPEERTTKANKEREEKGGSTPPWVIEDLWYRLDGVGYFGAERYAIHVVNVQTGSTRKLYDAAKFDNYSMDWLPDSTGLVVGHSTHTKPLVDKPADALFHIPLNGKPQQISGFLGSINNVAVSPDGATVALLGDVDREDPWGVRNTKAFVLPIKGGEAKCVSDGSDFCLAVATLGDAADVNFGGLLLWSKDSKSLYLGIGHHGEAQVGKIDVSGDTVELLTSGQHVIAVGNLSDDGSKMGCVYGTATEPNEVAVLDVASGTTQKLTALNQDFLDEVEVLAPEEMWVESTDGAKVHAWVIKPAGFQPTKRYPGVLEVHGGPHTQYGWGFFHEFQCLAAAGYVVAYSNPRGSKGYGEDFCAAIRGDWGNKDWADIDAVTQALRALPFVNSGLVGIMGGSYGGYMTNWAVGHSQDYKAAITDRCVSNWVSMAGNSDFPLNRDAYFGGHAWGDLDAISEMWRQSPIASFDKVTTPMLIIHSEGDLRCNVEQSDQVFHALQMQGVDSRYVRYPVETSHGMSRSGPPDLRIHRLHEILSWWEKYLR